jgi:hypothetical protein
MSGRADTAEDAVQDFQDRPVAGEDVAADQDLEHGFRGHSHPPSVAEGERGGQECDRLTDRGVGGVRLAEGAEHHEVVILDRSDLAMQPAGRTAPDGLAHDVSDDCRAREHHHV